MKDARAEVASPLLRALRGLESILTGIERLGAMLTLLSLILISTFLMLARNFGFTAPGWMDPLTHQLVLWAGLFGAVLAVQANAHIRFELVGPRLPPGPRRALDIVIHGLCAGVCGVLARACWAFVEMERLDATATIGMLPRWIFPAFIPVAFALMGIHFLLAIFLPAEGQTALSETETDADGDKVAGREAEGRSP